MTPAKNPTGAPETGSGFEPVLVVRADAGVTIGTGHVMRCLALAQAWQDAGGRAIFVMADSTAAIVDRLERENVAVVRLQSPRDTVEDARCVASLAHVRGADWVVVDGYHFGADYQRVLKDQGCRVLVLDDYGHAKQYVADLVLNQNTHATETLYKVRSAHTKLLLGSRYVLLRREFRVWRRWHREIASYGTHILVTLGGSDPGNVTSRVLEALNDVAVENLEVVIVAGGSNPHLTLLDRQIQGAHQSIRMVKDAANMPDLMAWADLAISAAGATCWEMCLLGLPAILIDLAPNQVPIANELNRSGVALHVGSASTLSLPNLADVVLRLSQSSEIRNLMSDRGKALVDGDGAARVVTILRGSETSRVPFSQPSNSSGSG